MNPNLNLDSTDYGCEIRLLNLEVDQRIHNPDSDSSHKTSESVDLTNLDSTDYVCEIRLLSPSMKDLACTKVIGPDLDLCMVLPFQKCLSKLK